MKFVVGGERYELTMEDVAAAVQGVQPEPVRAHLVELHNTVYPPKQVFAAATGRARQTFTTMEAQRVLSRLGFICRRAGKDESGQPAWVRQDNELDGDEPALEDRVASVEAQLGTAMTAIAGLAARVAHIEGQATQRVQ